MQRIIRKKACSCHDLSLVNPLLPLVLFALIFPANECIGKDLLGVRKPITTDPGALVHLDSEDHSVIREIPVDGTIRSRYVSLLLSPDGRELFGLERLSDGGWVFDLYRINSSTEVGEKLTRFSDPGLISISTATFGPRGLIYAIHGVAPSLTPAGTVFVLDPETGNVSEADWTTAGNTLFHALEYNPDDFKFYHFYINDKGSGVELQAETFSIPLNGNSYTSTSVPLDLQAAPTTVHGVAYIGNDRFIISDEDGDNFYLLTIRASDILVEALPAGADGFRRVDFASSGRSLSVPERGRLTTLDASTLAELRVQDSRIPGTPGLTCLAQNPKTGELYGILSAIDLNARLVKIDAASGKMETITDTTFRNDTHDGVHALVYIDDTLYCVAHKGARYLCAVDFETGDLIETGVILPTFFGDQCDFSYDPENNVLYFVCTTFVQVLGEERTQVYTVNLETDLVTEVDSFDLGERVESATWSQERSGIVMGFRISDEAWLWKPGESPTQLDDVEDLGGVVEVELLPDLAIGTKPSQLQGMGIRNGSATGQSIRVRTKRRRTTQIPLQLNNAGNNIDRATIRGTKGNRKLQIKYRLGSGNVTAAVTRSGLASQLLPGQTQGYSIQLKRRDRQKTARRNLTILSSSEDGIDVVKAKVLMRP